MMLEHKILVFFHISLWVFWLGTDLGVFLAAKMSENSSLSMETRSSVLRLGMVLDRLPRTCNALIFPSGLQLIANLQLIAVPGWILALVWLLGLAWVLIMWRGFLNPGTPAEKLFEKTNMPLSLLLCVGALAFAVATQTVAALEAPLWLAVKLVAVGLIGFAVVPLDRGFAPATATFGTIAQSGSTPELESRYHQQLQPVYGWVLFIYAMTIVAAFSGTVFGP